MQTLGAFKISSILSVCMSMFVFSMWVHVHLSVFTRLFCVSAWVFFNPLGIVCLFFILYVSVCLCVCVWSSRKAMQTVSYSSAPGINDKGDMQIKNMQRRPVLYPGIPVPWAHSTSATSLLCVWMQKLESNLTSLGILNVLAYAAFHFWGQSKPSWTVVHAP